MAAPQPWTVSPTKSNFNSNPAAKPRRLTRWSTHPSSPMSNSKTNQLRSSQEGSPMSQDTPLPASPASPPSTIPSSQSEKSPKTLMKSENVLKRPFSTMSLTQLANMRLDQTSPLLSGICVNPNPSSCLAPPSSESTTKASKSSWNEPSP